MKEADYNDLKDLNDFKDPNDPKATVRHIKQSFRQYMNGITAQSLSDKGCKYKISWGVSQQHLQEMASEYGKDKELALELWKSQVRECRLLAQMIMPPEEMTIEMARKWMQESHTRELKEMLVFNLLRHADYGFSLALEWLDSDDSLLKECGFNLAGRCFSNSRSNDKALISNYLRHAEQCLSSDNLALAHSALKSLMKYSALSEESQQSVDEILFQRRM